MKWLTYSCWSVVCFVGVGCGTSSSGADDSRVEAAREEAAATVAAREEARLAQQAEDDRRNWFCSTWTELYCRDQFGCHPDLTTTHLQECTTRLARFCDTRLTGPNWIDEQAESCFEATRDWDCSDSLTDVFADSCSGVFPLTERDEGDTCHFGGQLECGGDSVCNLPGALPSGALTCTGSCKPPVAEGDDCSDDTCAQGLDCVVEEDSRGLTVEVCREDEASGAPSAEEENGCAPHEQWVAAEGRCIAMSLPGEACGGTFGLQCLASRCVKGVCKWGESSPTEACLVGECMAPYRCAKVSGGELRCEVKDNDCDAHPMWLAQ